MDSEASHDQLINVDVLYDHRNEKEKILKRNSSNHRKISTTSSYEFIGSLINKNEEIIFVDGSGYKGTWDSLGISGTGSYRMPHDVIYEGEIRDGVTHGKGSLRYPGKQIIDGVWDRGEIKKFRYTFNDGLIFDDKNWKYLKFPDRRFNRSVKKGLNPGGKSLKTQNQPEKIIPSGCYDVGDGIFDPLTFCVTNSDKPSKIMRIPTKTESEWIMKNCRKGDMEPIGYRPSLNENWSSNPPNLPYRLPMSNNSPEKWWQRISTFEKDSNAVLDRRRKLCLLKIGEDLSSSESSEKLKIGGHSVCPCLSEISKSEFEEEYDICGDKDSKEISNADSDILREVLCEKMIDSDEEYEGGYGRDEDWLMTVCCPPGSTILKRKSSKKRSSKDFKETGGKEGEIKSLEESLEESFDGFYPDEENEEDKYYLRDFINDQIFRDEFTGEGEKEEDFRSFIKLPESKKKLIKKRKSDKARKINRRLRKSGRKVQKKAPCPDILNRDELLQRKVGDLLFSPALDAPRSPVYLVKKYCDRKVCKNIGKSLKRKDDFTKCGVSPSPDNYPKNKNRKKICKGDKKLTRKRKSENRNICSTPKPFVMIKE